MVWGEHGVGDFYVIPLSLLSYVETDTADVENFFYTSVNKRFFYSCYIFHLEIRVSVHH